MNRLLRAATGMLCCLLASAAFPREKASPGGGMTTEVQATYEELEEAVQDVTEDGIIQGSKEYDKDPYISSAAAVEATPVFPKWTADGRAFYKVKTGAIAPRNFDASNDSGTVAVRYVVQRKDETHSILSVEAIYVESEHRTRHLSNGSVETAEIKDVRDHVESEQQRKRLAAEAASQREQELARRSLASKDPLLDPASPAPSGSSAPRTLDQHVADLRHRLERTVKEPGTQLKAAPYKEAASLQALPPGSQVVILVVSPYWYGIETPSGQHGWVHHSAVEEIQ